LKKFPLVDPEPRPHPTRHCIHAASATLHRQGTMASPEIEGTEEPATVVVGDANGLVNHTEENAEKEATEEPPKEENIPVNEMEEKILDEALIDKHVFLSPTRRIRIYTSPWSIADACSGPGTKNEVK
jgi:hypothetical protein